MGALLVFAEGVNEQSPGIIPQGTVPKEQSPGSGRVRGCLRVEQVTEALNELGTQAENTSSLPHSPVGAAPLYR